MTTDSQGNLEVYHLRHGLFTFFTQNVDKINCISKLWADGKWLPLTLWVHFWMLWMTSAHNFSSLYFRQAHTTTWGGRGGTWAQNSFCSWAELLLVLRSCKNHEAGWGLLRSCCLLPFQLLLSPRLELLPTAGFCLCRRQYPMAGTSGDPALLHASGPGSQKSPTCMRGSSCNLLLTLPSSVAALHSSHDVRSCSWLLKPSRN